MAEENVLGICKSELDMFGDGPLQTQVESGWWVTYLPVTQATDSGTVEFDIKGNMEDYVDVGNSEMHINGRIVKIDDGSIVAGTDDVVPVAQLFHTLWAQVDVELNGQSVGTSLHYPYKCYMDSLLNYSREQINTLGAAEMFYPEKKMVVNTYGPDSSDVMIIARRDRIKDSKIISMQGPLRLGLCRTARYLPNNMNIRLRYTRQKPEFYLLWADPKAETSSGSKRSGYKFVIDDMWLQVRHVKLFPSVALAHATVLQSHDFHLMVPETEVQTFSITQGSMNCIRDNIYLGRNPGVVVVGLVSHLAYSGDRKRNPFYFNHFDLTSILLHVDGQPRPFQPIRVNFEAGNFIEAYRTLHRCLDQGPNDISASRVNPENCDKGYTIFAFDLTPDLTGEEGLRQIKSGSNIRLELNFAKPLPENINCIHWANFHGKLIIDRNRNVLFHSH